MGLRCTQIIIVGVKYVVNPLDNIGEIIEQERKLVDSIMVMHRTVNTDDSGSTPFLPASRNERSGRIATHKTVWEKDPTDKTQYMGL